MQEDSYSILPSPMNSEIGSSTDAATATGGQEPERGPTRDEDSQTRVEGMDMVDPPHHLGMQSIYTPPNDIAIAAWDGAIAVT